MLDETGAYTIEIGRDGTEFRVTFREVVTEASTGADTLTGGTHFELVAEIDGDARRATGIRTDGRISLRQCENAVRAWFAEVPMRTDDEVRAELPYRVELAPDGAPWWIVVGATYDGHALATGQIRLYESSCRTADYFDCQRSDVALAVVPREAPER